MHTQQLLSAVAPLSRGLCFLMPSQCADYEAVVLWKSGTRMPGLGLSVSPLRKPSRWPMHPMASAHWGPMTSVASSSSTM